MLCAARSRDENSGKHWVVHPESVDAERAQPIYVGHSWFLHRVPQLLVLVAVVVFVFHSLGGALLFGIPGVAAGLGLPWRFAVYSDGVDLWFSLGRRRVL